MKRRQLLATVAAVACTALPAASAAAAPASHSNATFQFGIVADTQYCDCAPGLGSGRYYADAPAKLADTARVFNAHRLAFTVQLGDMIDRDWASYDGIVPVWESIEGPRYSLLGNHDFPTPDLNRAMGELGMTHNYYDWTVQNWRFVALDTNDISLYEDPDGTPDHELAEQMLAELKASGAPNAQSWNGAVGPRQLAWLAGVLADAKAKDQKVVVFAHHPVAPDNMHNAWDDDAVRAVLESQGNVVAYFNGHNHAGNEAVVNGIQYLNLHGQVQDPYPANAFAIVKVQHNKLTVDGYGAEPDRVITVPKDRR